MEIGDIYIYGMCNSLVARARWYAMWEKLGVNHILKCINHLKNVLKGNRALWLLFNIQSSKCGSSTVAKVSLYSTCTWSNVSVKK